MGMGIRFVSKEEAAAKRKKVAEPHSGKVLFRKKKDTAGDPAIKTGVAVQTVDDFKVLSAMDLSAEAGHVKFLIHRNKKEVWYKVLLYDEYSSDSHNLKLESPYGAVFDTSLNVLSARFYMMAIAPDTVQKPSAKVLNYVHSFAE
jgi:hypothetical protein